MKKHNEVRGLYNNLVLLAGPSAGGKDTASNILVSDFGYKRLMTTTTRPMRDGEINDVTYHFVNEHAFLDLLKKRKLLETIEFCNNLYGLNVEEIENFSKGPDKVGVLILTPSGIKAVEDYVKEHTYMISPTMIGAYNDMLEQLGDLNTLPDCFFADNDTLALGAIKALKEKGVKIPKDISIIGFDDIPYSAVSSPALTTVHVQRKQIGKLAVEQLLKIKKDPKNKSVKTLITGNLIIRDSVAKKA